jgi:hypothetical protein
MFETTYPALDLFWTLLTLAVFVLWVWLIIVIIGDIFRSADLSGWGKALWTLLVIVLPWIGVVIYLIARGGSMSQRQVGRRQRLLSGDVYGPPTALSNEPVVAGGGPDPWPM